MGSCFTKSNDATEEKQYLLEQKQDDAEIIASYNTVIWIDDILDGNVKSLKLLKQCLIARGWCKIKYPDSINRKIKDIMNNIHKWLDETDRNKKLKYSLKLNDGINPNPQSEYGYNRIDGFKEGIRILTGDMYKIHKNNNKYPTEISNDILNINKIFDNLCLNIMKQIYKIYNLNNYNEFGTKYDISLLNDKMKFSMLDFVNYFNDKQYIENIRNNQYDNDKMNDLKPNVLKTNFNVFEHVDPGLFALSFLSTNDGLEMFDIVSKEWIKIGLNEGIWWNGKTATNINKNIKSGKHRVIINDKNYKPRFTAWYEVSRNKQLKQEIMQQTLNMKQNKYDTPDIPQFKRKFKIEYDYGIPSGKRFILDQDL